MDEVESGKHEGGVQVHIIYAVFLCSEWYIELNGMQKKKRKKRAKWNADPIFGSRKAPGVLIKILWRKASPRDPIPYPFIYHFWQKRYPKTQGVKKLT